LNATKYCNKIRRICGSNLPL